MDAFSVVNPRRFHEGVGHEGGLGCVLMHDVVVDARPSLGCTCASTFQVGGQTIALDA